MLVTPLTTTPPAREPGLDLFAHARRAMSFTMVRFLAVGSTGFAVDFAVFALLADQDVAEPLARAVSICVATLLTWLLNRRFTFGESARHAAVEGGVYTGVALAAVGVNYLTFLMLRASAPDMPALYAVACGGGLAALVSYTGQKRVTFRDSVRR